MSRHISCPTDLRLGITNSCFALLYSLDQDGKNQCPLDPYVVVHDKCRFVDAQSIKLQEAPDMVPVGELPRHMSLHAERSVAIIHLDLISTKHSFVILDT